MYSQKKLRLSLLVFSGSSCSQGIIVGKNSSTHQSSLTL